MEDFVWRYNVAKPNENRKVEITKFKYDDKEDMYAQILNEISLGGGPDIIVINKETDAYIDINKMSENNAFANMNILIGNSETFDLDSYNKVVLDAGVIDGKRVFMPISYEVPYLLGIEETFSHYNLEVPDKLTMDAYIELLEQYYQITNNEAVLWADPVYLLAEFYKPGELIENSEQLERLFELLKIENKRYTEPPVKRIYYTDLTYFDQYDPFIDKEYLIAVPKNYGNNQFRRIHENYNYIENAKESHMIWFEQPIIESSTAKAYTETGLAININSTHKNEAFEFVQFILSHAIQSNSLKLLHLPVNKETYDNEVESFVEGHNSMQYMFGIEDIDIPIEIKTEFIDYIESAEICEYIGSFRYIYINIMQQSIEDYYNDKITFDEMIDEINNKLAIYYTE